MTAQFPANLVTTSNIPDANPLTTLSANNHAGKHNDLRDEIIAIETKVGKDGSAVTTTHDYKLSGVTGTDKAVGATQTVSMSNKTMVSPKTTVGSDAIGDILYNSSGATGVQSRIAIGSSGQVLTSNGTNPFWTSPSATNTNYAPDTGAANAYVVTLSPALGAYTTGVLVQFKATNANTTASTVNVNGLGVKTIKKNDGATDLVANDIKIGQIVSLEYDGTNFQMVSPSGIALNSTGDGSGLVNLPGNKLNITTTDVNIANTSVETNILSYSVAGGLLSTNNAVRVTLHINSLVTGQASGTDAFTFRFKYGGTTLTTFTLTPTAASTYIGKIEFILAGAGTTSSQNGSHAANIGESAYAGSARKQYFADSAQGTSAIDSTTAQTLLVTGQYGSANASNIANISLIVVEKIN